MDWDTLRENWGAGREFVRQCWPLLMRDDIDVVAGSRRYLIDVICERYRWAPEEATHRVDAALPRLLQGLRPPGTAHAT